MRWGKEGRVRNIRVCKYSCDGNESGEKQVEAEVNEEEPGLEGFGEYSGRCLEAILTIGG